MNFSPNGSLASLTFFLLSAGLNTVQNPRHQLLNNLLREQRDSKLLASEEIFFNAINVCKINGINVANLFFFINEAECLPVVVTRSKSILSALVEDQEFLILIIAPFFSI